MAGMDEQNRDEFKKKLDDFNKQISIRDANNPPVRKFAAKYAIIYANEKYDELRKIDKHLADLRWTKNDLINSQATISMMDIPAENVTKLVDSTRKEVMTFDSIMAKKIKQHQKNGETIMIYAYVAGHGVADNQQYFLLNTADVNHALYPIE